MTNQEIAAQLLSIAASCDQDGRRTEAHYCRLAALQFPTEHARPEPLDDEARYLACEP